MVQRCGYSTLMRYSMWDDAQLSFRRSVCDKILSSGGVGRRERRKNERKNERKKVKIT